MAWHGMAGRGGAWPSEAWHSYFFGTAGRSKVRSGPVGLGKAGHGQARHEISMGGDYVVGEYEDYIRSAAWYAKREQRRMIDKSRCRTCGSTERLECHHVTYERFGDEDVENDLITLCHECHEAVTAVIRRRRYSARDYKVEILESKKEIPHVARKSISIEVSVSDVDAQWTNGRSDQRVRKSYEEYLRETGQD